MAKTGRPPKSSLGMRAWERGYSMRRLAEAAGISQSRLIKAANGSGALTRAEAVRVYCILEKPDWAVR